MPQQTFEPFARNVLPSSEGVKGVCEHSLSTHSCSPDEPLQAICAAQTNYRRESITKQWNKKWQTVHRKAYSQIQYVFFCQKLSRREVLQLLKGFDDGGQQRIYMKSESKYLFPHKFHLPWAFLHLDHKIDNNTKSDFELALSTGQCRHNFHSGCL